MVSEPKPGAAEAASATLAPRSSPWREWLAFGAVLAAAVVLYLPAIDKPFFADDFLFLDQVRTRSLTETWAAPDPISNFYRPVGRQLYFWVITRVAGQSPRAFHAVNLALFLVVLGLLYGLVRRTAGARAALIAAALVALHYSADVPVRWAGGAQELLAVAGALGALWLYVSGRRIPAAALLLVAALSKETALVTPAIALLLDRKPGEPWRDAARRLWPLAITVGVWVALWVAMPERRSQAATNVALEPMGPLSALAHLGQVAIGLEWRKGNLGALPRALPPLVPLALVLAAVSWQAMVAGKEWSAKSAPAPTARAEAKAPARATRGGKRGRGSVAPAKSKPRSRSAPLVVAGLAWALVATIPIAVVAGIWSSYYYLFAICGLAVAIAAWLAARPVWVASLVVGLAAIGSASARDLDEFAVARDLWSGQSHVNRFYIERANRYVSGYLGSLKRAYPTLPPRSTVFYSGLISNTAFQTADGPLLRWAYQDTSLRSHYVKFFSRDKAARGPIYFFVAEGDTLQDKTRDPNFLRNLASSMMVIDEPLGAAEVLEFWRQQSPKPEATRDYWRAWTALALRDTAQARSALRQIGLPFERGGGEVIAQALRSLDAGDTNSAMIITRAAVGRYPLEPAGHGLLADLLLLQDPSSAPGAIEAYAVHVLNPRDPIAWRRWATVQARHSRWNEAKASLERYFALRGNRNDPEAVRWLEIIQTQLPGSAAVQEGLRK